jgi:hypothetical protein
VQGSKSGANLNVQKYEQKQNYQISSRRVVSHFMMHIPRNYDLFKKYKGQFRKVQQGKPIELLNLYFILTFYNLQF